MVRDVGFESDETPFMVIDVRTKVAKFAVECIDLGKERSSILDIEVTWRSSNVVIAVAWRSSICPSRSSNLLSNELRSVSNF